MPQRGVASACGPPLGVALLLLTPAGGAAAEPLTSMGQASQPRRVVLAPVELPAAHWQAWRQNLGRHMTPEESLVFDELESDAERFAFVERFWAARDPTPRTARNEARRRFESSMALAASLFPVPDDPRAAALAQRGAPLSSLSLGDCNRFDFGVGTTRDSDVRTFAATHPKKGCTVPDLTVMGWPADVGRKALTLIFYRRDGACQRWRPGERLIPNAASNEVLLQRLEREGCFDELPQLRAALTAGFRMAAADLESSSLQLPRTGATVRSRADLEVRPGFGSEMRLEIGWMGRKVRQSFAPAALRPDRTRVTEGAAVLRADPAALAPWPEDLPWKTFSLVIDLRDLERGTVVRRALEMNVFDPLAALAIPFTIEAREGSHVATLQLSEGDVSYAPVAFAFDAPAEVEAPFAPRAEPGLLEALAAAPRVRLPESLAELTTGEVEVRVEVNGAIKEVELLLGGERVARLQAPAFSATVDFGAVPIMKPLQAVGRSEDGRVLARDEFVVNPGAQRLGVQLFDTEPLPYSRGARMVLRPRLRLQVPDGVGIDRVELLVGDVPLATLHGPPWIQTVEVERSSSPAVLRAVLHLEDGRVAETARVVAAGALEDRLLENLEIDYVEVYASVTRRGGRSVDDLDRSEVELLEDGSPQEIQRFERVRDLPLSVVLLVDSSSSMALRDNQVLEAARDFLGSVVSAKDRAALIQFNALPRVLVPLTSERERLEAAVDLMWMGGGTAFRDSVVTALHYLQGARGRRALVVLTDGVDEHSVLTAREMLEYAQRAGVAVYTLALGLHTSNPFALPPREGSASFAKSRDALRALQNLAEGSGGLAFNVASAERLPEAYRQIEEDLRSQYLLTFQSTQQGTEFRRLRVRLKRRGAKVRHAAGYYP